MNGRSERRALLLLAELGGWLLKSERKILVTFFLLLLFLVLVHCCSIPPKSSHRHTPPTPISESFMTWISNFSLPLLGSALLLLLLDVMVLVERKEKLANCFTSIWVRVCVCVLRVCGENFTEFLLPPRHNIKRERERECVCVSFYVFKELLKIFQPNTECGENYVKC